MPEIEQWLRSGAGVQEGLRLLSVYRPNPYLARMVERHPEKYRDLLIRALAGTDRKAVAATAASDRSFREDWPFLSKPDCPPELKILAADKITAWANFAAEHERLFSCVSAEQCLETAKKCVLFIDKIGKSSPNLHITGRRAECWVNIPFLRRRADTGKCSRRAPSN